MIKAVVLALALAVAPAQPPSTPIPRVIESVIVIHSDKSFCTAFATRVKQYVTAEHCVNDEPMKTILETPVVVVTRDKTHDLALVSIDEVRAPIALGDPPQVGDRVTSIGYGNTARHKFERFGPYLYLVPSLIMNLRYTPFEEDAEEMTLWGNGLSGMSGGPVIDREGHVVGVITGGGPVTSYLANVGTSVTYDALKKLLK